MVGGGARIFLWQRISAAYLTIFLFSLIGYVFTHHVNDYYSWHTLFQRNIVRLSAIFFFFALAVHAWIGMWTIATDYLKDAMVRFIFLLIVFGVLGTSLIWGILVLWS